MNAEVFTLHPLRDEGWGARARILRATSMPCYPTRAAGSPGHTRMLLAPATAEVLDAQRTCLLLYITDRWQGAGGPAWHLLLHLPGHDAGVRLKGEYLHGSGCKPATS